MQYKNEDDIQIQPKAKQNLEKLKSSGWAAPTSTKIPLVISAT